MTLAADEAARLCLYIARQGRSVAQGALPGVGPARALALLEHFGSVAEVLAADEAALSQVPGIGPRLAEKLVWAVRETVPVYGCGPSPARAPDDRPTGGAYPTRPR